MIDVAIVGAGELGGALAHLLAARDQIAHLRLIDETREIAAGKALDILQSASIHGSATRVSGSRDLYTAAGSRVIVVADAPSEASDERDPAILVGRIAQIAADSFVLFAGAAHCELVEKCVRELQLRRERVMGTAPEALRSALRAFVALEAGASPRDVALAVLGRPPLQLVVPWEEATIGGLAVTRVLDEPARRRLAARVGPLWPPGPYALAAAAAKAIDGLTGASRQLVSCFVAPDDSNGRRTRAVALPVRLGPEGLAGIETPQLNVHDRVALDNAMLL